MRRTRAPSIGAPLLESNTRPYGSTSALALLVSFASVGSTYTERISLSRATSSTQLPGTAAAARVCTYPTNTPVFAPVSESRSVSESPAGVVRRRSAVSIALASRLWSASTTRTKTASPPCTLAVASSGIGCVGSIVVPSESTGAGSVTRPLLATHWVGPAVLWVPAGAATARRIAVADGDGGGTTIAVTGLLVTCAAAPPVPDQETVATF